MFENVVFDFQKPEQNIKTTFIRLEKKHVWQFLKSVFRNELMINFVLNTLTSFDLS